MADSVLGTATTPNRTATVTLDYQEPVKTALDFAVPRMGGKIRPLAKSGTVRLSSGAWTLKPLNQPLYYGNTTDGQTATLRLSDWNFTAGYVAEAPYARQLAELTGVTYAPGIAASGNYFQRKTVSAGLTWSANYAGAIAGLGLTSADVQTERLVESKAIHDPMTGYLVQLQGPSGSLRPDSPQQHFTFYFGGPVTASGYGQFALWVASDGEAVLYEYYNTTWNEVSRWRLFPANSHPNHLILLIQPHGNRYIQFSTFHSVIAGQNIMAAASAAAINAIESSLHEERAVHLHEITNRDLGYSATSNLITGSGRIAFDFPITARTAFQVQRLIYPASGTLTDSVFQIPGGFSGPTSTPADPNAKILRINGFWWDYVNGGQRITNVTFQPQDASQATPTNLTAGSESFTYNGVAQSYTGWQIPGGQNLIQTVITLSTTESAPRFHTPSFLGYQAVRSSTVATKGGSGTTVARVRGFSAVGPGMHPEDESASIQITDETDSLSSLLLTRGKMPVKVETTYDDSGKTSILYEGYVGRAQATLRGKAGRVYPSPNWHDYLVTCLPKADRLRDTFFTSLKVFWADTTSPTGGDPNATSYQAWKVTDVIHQCLLDAGWTESQLDIPDNPLRLFPLGGANGAHYYAPAVGTNYADYAQRIARDYLNQYLLWDANAGTNGKWRLMTPPQNSSSPVWNFVTTPAPPGRLSNRSESYGTKTSPILNVEEGTPFQSHIIPAEANLVIVLGGPKGQGKDSGVRFQQFAPNRASWDAPGWSQADPSSLDYLGRCVPYIYADMTLRSQAAVNFVTRRIFEIACRGRKFVEFTAPLVLIDVSTEKDWQGNSVYSTHTHRPLRFGDLVTVDGTPFIVHGCNPNFTKSHHQLAHYECELWRAGLTFGPH
jgi:hypothetical protein